MGCASSPTDFDSERARRLGRRFATSRVRRSPVRAAVTGKVKRNFRNMTKNQLLRMDNVLLVVDDLKAAIAFFTELGLELEGETTVEGPGVDRSVGLEGVRSDIAMMRTPDGHGRLELDKFHTPRAVRTESEDAPVNSLGIRRIMFAVTDIDEVIARLQMHGAELIGEVTQFESYRLCYLRGPEGILIALAEQLGDKSVTDALGT